VALNFHKHEVAIWLGSPVRHSINIKQKLPRGKDLLFCSLLKVSDKPSKFSSDLFLYLTLQLMVGIMKSVLLLLALGAVSNANPSREAQAQPREVSSVLYLNKIGFHGR
jgi:hypothetical protein